MKGKAWFLWDFLEHLVSLQLIITAFLAACCLWFIQLYFTKIDLFNSSIPCSHSEGSWLLCRVKIYLYLRVTWFASLPMLHRLRALKGIWFISSFWNFSPSTIPTKSVSFTGRWRKHTLCYSRIYKVWISQLPQSLEPTLRFLVCNQKFLAFIDIREIISLRSII